MIKSVKQTSLVSFGYSFDLFVYLFAPTGHNLESVVYHTECNYDVITHLTPMCATTTIIIITLNAG